MERSAIFSPHGIFNVKFNSFQVNDVLVDLGYKALPCPVARVTKRDPEIQQKIMELKRERQLEEEEEEEEEEREEEEVERANDPHTPPRVFGCFVTLKNIDGSLKKTASSSQHQQSNTHVSFGPEFVRHIPARSNKF